MPTHWRNPNSKQSSFPNFLRANQKATAEVTCKAPTLTLCKTRLFTPDMNFLCTTQRDPMMSTPMLVWKPAEFKAKHKGMHFLYTVSDSTGQQNDQMGWQLCHSHYQ